MPIYFGTASVEMNRWTPERMPSILASTYIARALTDGFSGVELWENHFLLADKQEQKRILELGNIAIFNTYLTFDQGITDEMREIAKVINQIAPWGIKFNFQKRETAPLQLDTIQRFAEMLHPDIQLLCEAHAGTMMEQPEFAAEIYDKLDARFGSMIHLTMEESYVRRCFEAYGEHIRHIHICNYTTVDGARGFYPLENARGLIQKNFSVMQQHGFAGSYTLEFAYGKDAETMYQSGVRDRLWLKEKKIV